jgi:hypothetical protein
VSTVHHGAPNDALADALRSAQTAADLLQQAVLHAVDGEHSSLVRLVDLHSDVVSLIQRAIAQLPT